MRYDFGPGELTQTTFVKHMKTKVTGFVSGTSEGHLQVVSYPFHECGISQQIQHKGPISRLKATADFNYLFSAGEDGVLYIYEIKTENVPVHEDIAVCGPEAENIWRQNLSMNGEVNKEEEEPKPLMKPSLATVVLCSQYQMEQWQDKKNQLESDLENVKRMVESSLIDCQDRYDKQFDAALKKKIGDYDQLKKRCDDLRQ
jgi:hypothetical protein